MARLGAIVRLLMLAACLAPFTSARQASAALAPVLPSVPAPTAPAPAPVSEEDERETAAGKERQAAPQSARRAHARERTDGLSPGHAAHRKHLTPVLASPPSAVDPFRNGLGSPYLC